LWLESVMWAVPYLSFYVGILNSFKYRKLYFSTEYFQWEIRFT